MADFICTWSICFTPGEVRKARVLRRYRGRSFAAIAKALGGCEAWHVRAMLQVAR